MSEYLTSMVKTVRVLNAVGVGTTTQTTTAVDMQGFEGVRFICAFGAITDGTPSIQARQGQLSNMTDAAGLAGTNVVEAVTDDNRLAIVDIWQPQERYVDLQIIRGGSTGAVIDGVVAELYGARKQPVAKDASVANQETWSSPAEGTP